MRDLRVLETSDTDLTVISTRGETASGLEEDVKIAVAGGALREHGRRTLDAIHSPDGDIEHLALTDIIDAPAIQSLMNDFYRLTGVPMSVIDVQGKVVVGVGWQDICTRFHRAHPETCRYCVESDTLLSAGVKPGESRLYKCKNNMWDAATPIVVEGRHLGNVFTGQFFFDNEPVDRELFRSQARRYGFDEEAYLAALEVVPRLSRHSFDRGLAFLVKLAHILSQLSYSNIKFARSAIQREALMESLRESQQRLERTQAIAHLGSWELDLARNRLSWSREVHRIFGLEPQEVPATYEAFLEAVHPHDRAGVDAAYSSSLKEGRSSYEIEHRIVRRTTGEVGWVYEKCEHSRDKSGKVVRSVGMVLDITERKRAEDAVREANMQLMEAGRCKDQFLAMLSHELRNPLAPIRNSLHILEHAAPGGDQAKRARDVIDRQVNHLTRLIDDLLDMTRISTGKIGLHRERLELGELVRRTAEDYRALFATNGIELHIAAASQPLWVHGDATRLAQVIGNLLHNAAKFTDRGGRSTITVASSEPTAEATICVRDTGIGITADLLPRVFEQFSQADMTLERSRGGLGLGLALVDGLVRLHGGMVVARSEGAGQGAEFVVTLPLAQREEPHPERAPATNTDGVPRRVLVIEDNIDAADSLRAVLELRHHIVEVAQTGPDGIVRARVFRPEVVFCDIGLPGMDGYAVARTMREDPELSSIFLFALSGYTLAEDVNRAKRAGFDGHLAKPTDVATIERVLAEARPGGAVDGSRCLGNRSLARST